MAKEQQCAAKGQMIALMQVGRTFQEAATMAGVQISRSAAYDSCEEYAPTWRSRFVRWQT
jgi:hypothetical protein